MRRNFGPQPYLFPMPVLIIGTYNEDGIPNAMNAAWGTIADMDRVAIFLADHKTTQNIFARRDFTVSLATADQVVPADYVGIVSANDEPAKFAKTGWTAEKSAHVDAPLFAQLPVALECRMVSYDEESELLIGEIVNVCADESVLREDGSVDMAKLRPIAYDPMNHDYLLVTEKVGNAFEDGVELK
ncbi:MAG: flavin reductase family protein [Ruminiclostridium sp.]|nr:flavin reductase family protein [Ruminiclostridium sp.]